MSSGAMQIKTWLLLVFFSSDAFVSSSDDVARIKRTDIDLQTCIDNFDIHRDKIIRTQDSQNMGAKYLNEIDLGTREECLRLCCETENCDVFVFEEKNSGSCYLFHCGPPEDFKCKFTHHVNYSSAVLAINRHLPDLESQIKLTKHEQDLTKLRKPEPDLDALPPAAETRTSPPATSTTTAKSKEVLPAAQETKTKAPEEVPVRKCSRYQFECRSTSECIAIYNACDGIPQCADGSDEAPELGCPESTTNPPPPPPPPHANNPAPSSQQRYETNISPPRIHPLPAAASQPEIYRPQMPQETLGVSQLQAMPHQDQDFIRPVANQRTQGSFESDMIPQEGNPAVIPWIAHQSNQMPMQIPQYADNKNSRIFTHKENGLQVPDGQEIRYNKHKGAMQYLHRALGHSNTGQIQYNDARPQYNQKIANYYDAYRPPMPENWPANPPQEDFNRYPQQAPANKNWQQSTNIQNVPMKEQSPPEHPFIDPIRENPKHEQDKMAHELKHSKDNMEHVVSGDTKIKIEKHKHHHEQYPEVVAYKIDGSLDLPDGAAQTPGGAVLSLTLGLIITCIMALLIACRLRVKRRMRKGGKSYAHEADYLVNGMYL